MLNIGLNITIQLSDKFVRSHLVFQGINDSKQILLSVCDLYNYSCVIVFMNRFTVDQYLISYIRLSSTTCIGWSLYCTSASEVTLKDIGKSTIA